MIEEPPRSVRLTLTRTRDGKCLLEKEFPNLGRAIECARDFDQRAEAKSTGGAGRRAQANYDSIRDPISPQAAAGAPGLGKKG